MIRVALQERRQRGRSGGDMGHPHALQDRVDLLLQGLKATLFELQLLLEVNHLSLELVDLDGRRPQTGLDQRVIWNCGLPSPLRGTQSSPEPLHNDSGRISLGPHGPDAFPSLMWRWSLQLLVQSASQPDCPTGHP